MRYLAIGIVLSAAFLAPYGLGAQGTAPASEVPGVLADPLGFVQEKLGINLESFGISTQMLAPDRVVAGASELWNNAQVWLRDHLGVDASHLLRGVLDLVIWMCEFAIRLFQSALGLL